MGIDKQEKARHAKELLANPLFLVMREDIEQELIREWKGSHLIENLSLPDQVALREMIWHRVQAVEHINQLLQKYIQEGYVRPEEKKDKVLALRKNPTLKGNQWK